VDYAEGDFLPDGRRIVFNGSEPGKPPRCYLQDLAAGSVTPVSPEGTLLRLGQKVLSPDGRYVAAQTFDRKVLLYPLAGGDPKPIPGLVPGDTPIRWSVDEQSLYVFREKGTTPRIHLVHLTTGENKLWKEISPGDPAGLSAIWGVHIGPDDRSYYYSYNRRLTDLFLVQGLR